MSDMNICILDKIIISTVIIFNIIFDVNLNTIVLRA